MLDILLCTVVNNNFHLNLIKVLSTCGRDNKKRWKTIVILKNSDLCSFSDSCFFKTPSFHLKRKIQVERLCKNSY